MNREYRKIYCCGDCVQYDWKKHRCRAGAHVEGEADESFFRDCPETIYREDQERKTGRWTIEAVNSYDLAYGTTAYEPIYKCSACGMTAESYLRLDKPVMPEDADFPKYCPNCGVKMVNWDGLEKEPEDDGK